MKVSCLCVTERRPEFWPWLLWSYDRQTYDDRELIVVAGENDDLDVPQKETVRILRAPAGAPVGRKRNLALNAARGDVVAWFDDDDWQNPGRLARIVEAIARGAAVAGGRRSWFLDLAGNRCEPYHAASGVVFNGAGFQRELVKGIWFDPARRKGSDTLWMREVLRRAGRRVHNVDDIYLSLWLCHDRNLSNPARARRFRHPLDDVRRAVGPADWGDSDEQLDALRRRLGIGANPSLSVANHPRELRRSLAPRSEALEHAKPKPAPAKSRAAQMTIEARSSVAPPVSAVVKVTVLDTPWLETLIPHMLEQARYAFHERLIVVDRRPEFTGKYATRGRSTPGELNAALERLQAAGHVDRVVQVDYGRDRIRGVMQRYFGELDVPTHASTGGPIYPTLFGLEEASSDHVAQFDSDVLFWTDGTSWIEQSLAAMKRDPALWLMMTHAGPIGPDRFQSLGGRNRRSAAWDAASTLWKFDHATTRYFLCDRRKLRGRIPVVRRLGGCAPLEVCLGAMLKAERAFRGNLADGTSWHLHAWSHDSPFTEWAPSLVKAVSEGRFPPSQVGSYDLRLDRSAERRSWLEILGNETPRPAARRNVVRREPARPVQDRLDKQPAAPIGVVIPVRDRTAEWLSPAVAGLAWQETGRPEQVIIVSHGSRADVDRGLEALCEKNPWVRLIRFGTPEEPWNKPKALNIGIRATDERLPFLMVLDADIILAPDFFHAVLAEFERHPLSLAMCRISDLPSTSTVPRDTNELLRMFPELRRQTRLRGRHGTGAMQAAPRSFFFQVRGYDEDFLWWGAMDTDIVHRAQACGLRIAWLENRTSMLHQWHPRKNSILKDRRLAATADRQWRINHDMLRKRSNRILRNPLGWGVHEGLYRTCAPPEEGRCTAQDELESWRSTTRAAASGGTPNASSGL
jgi:glycosyltransferase involved in cell wall biosynthesis